MASAVAPQPHPASPPEPEAALSPLAAQVGEDVPALLGVALGAQPHLVVGFSGGCDSMALLAALAEWAASQKGVRLTVAYIHHGWRNQPGQPPAELPLIDQALKTLRERYHLALPLLMANVPEGVRQRETDARQWRYALLGRLVSDTGADALVTAHHADDQIETLLFRLFRGTGIEGLRGIPATSERVLPDNTRFRLIRPLLDTPRDTLRKHCNKAGLKYFNDPGNDDKRHTRNHIRHELLPRIEKAFPQVRASLAHLSEQCAGDLTIVQQRVARIWPNVVDEVESRIRLLVFNQLSEAMQRRILRRFLAMYGVAPGYIQLEHLLGFIAGKQRHQQGNVRHPLGKTPGGQTYYAWIYDQYLYVVGEDSLKPITDPNAERPPAFEPQTLPLTRGELLVPYPGGRQLCVSVVRESGQASDVGNDWDVWVDLRAHLDSGLCIRPARADDRYRPLGMATPMRLKKFLANRKVPPMFRDQLPVLADRGTTVLWVPGYGLSHEIRVQDRASHHLSVQLLESGALPVQPDRLPDSFEALEDEPVAIITLDEEGNPQQPGATEALEDDEDEYLTEDDDE